MLDINTRCTHILTKLFLPDFKRRNKGHILNVASSAAFLPAPCSPPITPPRPMSSGCPRPSPRNSAGLAVR